MGLTAEQIGSFHRDGFLIVENVLRPDELAAMRQRADEIAGGTLPEGSPIQRQVEPAISRREMAANTYRDSLATSPAPTSSGRSPSRRGPTTRHWPPPARCRVRCH